MSKEYRVIFEPDPEPDKSWLDQPEFAGEDPDRHLMVLGRVECQSSYPDGTGPWTTVASLGNIDTIPDDPDCEPFELGEFETDYEFRFGYQQDVVDDLMSEALAAETHPDPKLVELFSRRRRITNMTGEGTLDLAQQLAHMREAAERGDTEVTTDFGTHGITYGSEFRDGRYPYATVGFVLPEGVYAEIEDGTYGSLNGLRFPLDIQEPKSHPGTVGAVMR